MKRNYGIDLLRLVLMFMVVMLHVLGTGGVIWSAPLFTGHYFIAWGLEALCYCAVNSFALITGYVHYKTKYKVSSIVTLTAQALCYSLSITALFAFVQPDSVTVDAWISALFPIHRVSWWYVSAYGGLFLLIPMLEPAVRAFTERQAAVFCAAAFVAFSVLPTVLVSDPFVMSYGYGTLWLVYLYLVGAFIKRFDWGAGVSAKQHFAGFLSCVAVTALSKYVIDAVTLWLLGQSQFSTILLSNTSPTVVAASVALLMAFAKLELNTAATKVVRKLSPAAFGVYLIHCHPLIFAKLTGQFAFLLGFPALQMTGMLLGAGMAIYVPCLLADLLRHFLFRKLGFRKLMERLDARMARFLKEPVK